MAAETIRRNIEVSRRVDGEPWKIRVLEVKGSASGPTTAFVAGIYGEEPLACLMMLELERRLRAMDLKGTVIIIPAANPPALSIGTRLSPDGLLMNRVFPGSPSGLLTNQLAHAVFSELKERTDCIIDFHSGVATFGCWFVYDHGDTALAASFGLPIVQNMKRDGQLAVAATKHGLKSFLVEIGLGRGDPQDIEGAVAASIETLKFRGHIDAAPAGPKSVPLMPEVSLFINSAHGAFVGKYGIDDIGKTLPQGELGHIVSVSTGERVEEFRLEREGRLILANVSPFMMPPGGFPYMVGHVSGEFDRR